MISNNLPQSLLDDLQCYRNVFWLNPDYRDDTQALTSLPVTFQDMRNAQSLLQRFAPFIAKKFPETALQHGRIESPLIPIPAMHERLRALYQHPLPGRLLLKGDHQLPISGSIKARGGIFEVLKFAEQIACKAHILTHDDSYERLTEPQFRDFFSRYTIVVGSTGNLGLSIGIIGRALGFKVLVHMSSEARQWKKDLLRQHQATVVEHSGDYSQAVAAGRAEAAMQPDWHFVDDEQSLDLLLGYATAAFNLERQLHDIGLAVDQDHPLFVYLPCGVGGGPGGITLGLKQIFGTHVHCFFAEPAHSPAMLVGLASGRHEAISVEDIGLDNLTAADGLAVARPSGLVGRMLSSMIAGVYTVQDNELFRDLALLADSERIRMEPSALAGVSGFPRIFKETGFTADCSTQSQLACATHIVWGTGGSMVPEDQMMHYLERGRNLLNSLYGG